MRIESGKYLITGIAGTGKTTIAGELAGRGFCAYSTDEMPEVSGFQDRATGVFTMPPDDGKPTDFSRYAWSWREEGLEQLLATDPTVFIAASVHNQYDLVHHFDKVFALLIDPETLRERITSRTNNAYGKRPEELERILSLHHEREQQALAYGAIAINSVQPKELVVDDILNYLQYDNP